MSDKPKRKHGPIHYIWHRARSHPIPFSYEVEGSLEHVVSVMRGFRSEINYFVIDETPSYNLKEYHFTLKAGDDAVGRVFQISETRCAIEGTITILLWPFYVALVMLFLSAASFPTPLREPCGLPLLLLALPLAYAARPRPSYYPTLELLETAVRRIEDTPPAYIPSLKINPHPVPKHSRPSDVAEHDDAEQQKRKRSS